MTNHLSELRSNLSQATRGAVVGALSPKKAARFMGRLIRGKGGAPGTPPGTLLHTGDRRMEKVSLRLLVYDGDEFREEVLSSVSEAVPARDAPSVAWLNVDGLHDSGVMEEIRDHFRLHPLVMEDVMNVGQRAKVEEYQDFLFLVLPMLSFREETGSVDVEQVSLVLGPSWVLTFQEWSGDVFEPVRERLRKAYGRIRHRKADSLAYALTDAVVDRYFVILERLADVAEELDQDVADDPGPAAMHRISHLKRELLLLRKAVWPLREALGSVIRTESDLVTEPTRLFLRDVHDHAVQVIDTVETLRDVASGMMDLYLSTLGQKTNEVMKVLTIMASIFIPLTFLAGIYGMNFQYMPELQEPWGYPALLVLMVLVAGGLIVYFRRKGWL